MGRHKLDLPKIWEERKGEALEIIKEGGTIEDVCKYLRCSSSPFYVFLKDNKDAMAEIEQARSVPLRQVRNALYRNCLGFTVTDTKETIITTANGPQTKTETITRTIPPNQRAIEVFLRNHTDGFRDNDKFTQDVKEKELKLKEEKMNSSEEW